MHALVPSFPIHTERGEKIKTEQEGEEGNKKTEARQTVDRGKTKLSMQKKGGIMAESAYT